MYHGVWSMFQTLGLSDENTGRLCRPLGIVSSFVVVLGNISVPAGVLVGLVK